MRRKQKQQQHYRITLSMMEDSINALLSHSCISRGDVDSTRCYNERIEDSLRRTTKENFANDVELHEKKLKEHLKKKKLKKKRKKSAVTACVASCKYDLVKRNIEAAGIVLTKEESSSNTESNLVWCDCIVQSDRIHDLKNYQRINHFPNMGEICRKDFLARNMSKMARARAEEYNFTPRSWIMPAEYNSLCIYAQNYRKSKRRSPVFIHKPSNGAMGNGIHLFRNPEKLHLGEQRVVQEYLNKPLLLDGYKFDLRLYVLVTHCDPLRAFIYQDGLVRLSTEKYNPATDQNLDQLFMHLTNYSVNKYNENFERHQDLDRGSKRSVKSLMKYLADAGHDTVKLWRDISDLCVKTLILVSPQVTHAYRMCRPGQNPHLDSVCFEVLGFDIFIDRKLKPWLLEVNRAPSFGGDERIDREVKNGVIHDALVLVNIRASDKRKNIALQKAETRKRLFRNVNVTRQDPEMIRRMNKNGKNILDIGRRKKTLKDKLAWVRKEAIREEYEDQHMGNYKRIFPCVDPDQRKRYTSLLAEAFKIFNYMQSTPSKRDYMDYYNPKREDEILSMIEQCEEEEGIQPHRKKSLSSMPVISQRLKMESHSSASSNGDSESDSNSDSSEEDGIRYGQLETLTKNSKKKEDKPKVSLFPPARQTPDGIKRISSSSDHRLHRESSSKNRNINGDIALVDVSSRSPSRLTGTLDNLDNNHNNGCLNRTSAFDDSNRYTIAMRERETENIQRTLDALERTTIKFPGKTQLEADMLLDFILENWEEHKAKVAHYWLVQLDTVKRKKVIEIVQGNVRAVVERVWKWSKMSSLKINRLFVRVFNRMQWNRGQGLWNCFLPESQDSWETMFSKSSEVVTDTELRCCKKIVQLCKECLLIVYQFANESKRLSHVTAAQYQRLANPKEKQSNVSNTTTSNGSSVSGAMKKPSSFSGSFTGMPRRHSVGAALKSDNGYLPPDKMETQRSRRTSAAKEAPIDLASLISTLSKTPNSVQAWLQQPPSFNTDELVILKSMYAMYRHDHSTQLNARRQGDHTRYSRKYEESRQKLTSDSRRSSARPNRYASQHLT